MTELMALRFTCTSYIYNYKNPAIGTIAHFYLLHFL